MGLDAPELSKLHAGLDLTTSEGYLDLCKKSDWRLSSTVVGSGPRMELEFIWELGECLSRRLIYKDREGRPLFSKLYARRPRQTVLEADRDLLEETRI
jgi:hypothetical protein